MPNKDAKRLSGLIEPHLDALFRAAFRLARNRPDAEDLVQETCVRACQRISTLDESRQIKAWLLRVLYNLFIDGTRRVRRTPVSSQSDETDRVASSAGTDRSPEELTHTSQREDQLQRAWLKLSHPQRALLALRIEGYELSEIAEVTSLTNSAISARLYRARQSFARHLKDEETNEQDSRKEAAK